MPNQEVSSLIVQMGEIAFQIKDLESKYDALWAKCHKYFDSEFGEPSIDNEGNKHGAGVVRVGRLEVGRKVSDYGSKLDPEKLERLLMILAKEGVIDEDEVNKIVKKRKETTTIYTIDELELSVLATTIQEVWEAASRSKTPPEIRVSKINPKFVS